MGRELGFWKTRRINSKPNSELYNELASGAEFDYLEKLPLQDILKKYKTAFKDWENPSELLFEKENQALELTTGSQFVRVDCYGATIETLNKIVDIMLEFGCPLYDASIDIRFDS